MDGKKQDLRLDAAIKAELKKQDEKARARREAEDAQRLAELKSALQASAQESTKELGQPTIQTVFSELHSAALDFHDALFGRKAKSKHAQPLVPPAKGSAVSEPEKTPQLDAVVRGVISSKKVKLAAWNELKIRFLSDHRVEIKTNLVNLTMNYAEMGFEDKRNGSMSAARYQFVTGKPTKAWTTLQALARNNGVLPGTGGAPSSRRPIEKRVQELRKNLRLLFACPGDPIPLVKGTGYTTHFKIYWSPAANS
jgi:hypothetical protein